LVEATESKILEAIKSNFPHDVEEAEVLRPKRISVTVKSEKILDVARFLKEKLNFDYLLSVGAVDYIKEKLGKCLE